MGYAPLIHHRRSIRLKGYDDRQARNHFHGIIVLTEASVGTIRRVASTERARRLASGYLDKTWNHPVQKSFERRSQ